MTNKKELPKVYVYARYSSEMQNYLSIEAQVRAVKEFCKGKYQIVKTYIDEAKSATTADRPQFQQMINDCENNKGKIYAVVVHKLDRFSRNSMDALYYKAFLEKHNIKLISVTEPLEDTPESTMFANILFALNQFYSENLGREVQKGKKEVAYKGLHTGGLPPYGYDVDENRKYIINESESSAVRRIYEMYVADYSYQQIADYLNKNGYKTKKGNKFNKNSFSSILQNGERYTGVYIYNQSAAKYSNGQRNSHHYKDDKDIIRIPDGMPQIISHDLYMKSQEKLIANRLNAGAFHSKRYYMLNGLIKCGTCGRAFSGNTSKSGGSKTEYATYRCGGSSDDCDNKAINVHYLDDFVLTKLIDMIFAKRNCKGILDSINRKMKREVERNSKQIVRLKNKIVQVDASINKLIEALTKTENSSAITDRIAELEKEKATLENKVTELENFETMLFCNDDIEVVKRKFKSFLLKKDLLMCRKFIRSYVEKIVIYHDEIEVVFKTTKEGAEKAA